MEQKNIEREPLSGGTCPDPREISERCMSSFRSKGSYLKNSASEEARFLLFHPRMEGSVTSL